MPGGQRMFAACGLWRVSHADRSCEPMISPQRSACVRAAMPGDPLGGYADRPRAMSRDGRQLKERSMRKGFLASVAALAAGAGVALGQGAPGQPPAVPPTFPTWPGAGPGAPAVVPNGSPLPYAGAPGMYPGAPSGYPAGPTDFQGAPMGYPGGPAPSPSAGCRRASEMPQYGPVP